MCEPRWSDPLTIGGDWDNEMFSGLACPHQDVTGLQIECIHLSGKPLESGGGQIRED